MFTFIHAAGTKSHFALDVFGRAIAKENAVPNSQPNLQSESIMADLFLGVTVTGLYTLVGMGLVLVFM
jgi:hypothetical protein